MRTLTAHPIAQPHRPHEQLIQLREGELVAGYVLKVKNTRTETYPWTAYAADGYGRAGELLGHFYGRTGRRDAERAVAAAGKANRWVGSKLA